MEWSDVEKSFHVLPATVLASMNRMERHQDLDRRVWWRGAAPPVALLFVSHRWETLAHPDPAGRQLRAVQRLVELICASVEAMFLTREERTARIPSLEREGLVQSVEIARRMLGFGPFGDSTVALGGKQARREIRERWERQGGGASFREWMSGRVGVWLDYCCMPQKPHTPEEEAEFRSALAALGDLVMSSTVVSLRCRGDDYPRRAWCASEFFLGSHRSFANGIYLDLDRLERGDEVGSVDAPTSNSAVDDLLVEGYEQDREDFDRACRDWLTLDAPMIDGIPPAAWAPYRWMAGNSRVPLDEDPNPFRQLLLALMELETDLIRHWLMSPDPGTIDLAWEAEQCLSRHDLHCADPHDLGYVGVLSGAHCWVEELRPLFREALARYPRLRGQEPWRCPVQLEPLEPDVRGAFSRLEPRSPGVWHSRLTTGPGPYPGEKEAVEALREELRLRPPGFAFIKSDVPGRALRQLR